MRKIADSLSLVAITLWAGGLWITGYMVAPALFAAFPGRELAGMLADRMFSLLGYVGMVCGTYLLGYRLSIFGGKTLKQPFFWAALLMLVLTVVGHLGLQAALIDAQPESWPGELLRNIFRDRFAAWNGISSLFYLVQSLLGVVLVVKSGD